jgi:hypothetical protein
VDPAPTTTTANRHPTRVVLRSARILGSIIIAGGTLGLFSAVHQVDGLSVASVGGYLPVLSSLVDLSTAAAMIGVGLHLVCRRR